MGPPEATRGLIPEFDPQGAGGGHRTRVGPLANAQWAFVGGYTVQDFSSL